MGQSKGTTFFDETTCRHKFIDHKLTVGQLIDEAKSILYRHGFETVPYIS